MSRSIDVVIRVVVGLFLVQASIFECSGGEIAGVVTGVVVRGMPGLNRSISRCGGWHSWCGGRYTCSILCAGSSDVDEFLWQTLMFLSCERCPIQINPHLSPI